MNYHLLSFFDLVLVINAFILMLIIILERRKPERTLAWVLVFIFFPVL